MLQGYNQYLEKTRQTHPDASVLWGAKCRAWSAPYVANFVTHGVSGRAPDTIIKSGDPYWPFSNEKFRASQVS